MEARELVREGGAERIKEGHGTPCVLRFRIHGEDKASVQGIQEGVYTTATQTSLSLLTSFEG